MTQDDPYATIAEIYEFSYNDFLDDVDFYDNLERAVDGPILELGVSSGRVAIPLAQAGYDVVGIDNPPAMLEQARLRLESEGAGEGSLELVRGEMTEFGFERQFGMVFCAANTFQHMLTTQDQAACLRRAEIGRAHV